MALSPTSRRRAPSPADLLDVVLEPRNTRKTRKEETRRARRLSPRPPLTAYIPFVSFVCFVVRSLPAVHAPHLDASACIAHAWAPGQAGGVRKRRTTSASASGCV